MKKVFALASVLAAGLTAGAVDGSSVLAKAQAAIDRGTDLRAGRFRLDAGAGRTIYGAAWEPGTDGSPTNGRLAFTDGTRTLVMEGFGLVVAGTGGVPQISFSVEKGTLSARLSLSGAKRNLRGEPRYSWIRPNRWSAKPLRFYAGMGNVVERPGKFRLDGGGFRLSTRHVGVDFEGGLSLVMATDVFPNHLDCDAEKGVLGPVVCEDATWRFTPSSEGACEAAIRFAEISGYRKSAGFDRLCGRMVLDQWGGDYGEAAEDLVRVADYGVTNAVFVKHVWQRHGYDVQLPDIYPPAGDFAAFKAMVAAAQRYGTDFCPHDNYIDYYSNATGFAESCLMHNAEGKPIRGWFNRSVGVQSWKWLPGAYRPLLERNMRLMREGFGPDGLFIDVFTATKPPAYYDAAGRYFTAANSVREWGRVFDDCRRLLGRPQGPMISEAGTDALVGHVDAGEADHYPADRWRIPREQFGDGERIPWHDLVTHGRMILTGGGLGHRYSGGQEDCLHGYASDDYLATTAIGGRNPMCEGPFGRGAVMTDWLLKDVLEPLARGAFTSFSFADGDIRRQHAVFTSGEVWVNRATNAVWRVAKRELPRDGFLVRSSAGEAGVVRLQGQRVAYARTEGCLFVDARPPYFAGGRDYGRVTVKDATALGGEKWRIAVSTVLSNMPGDARPFVHLVPKGQEGPIVAQGRYDPGEEGSVTVALPGTNRYDVLIGFYRPGGRRYSLRNAEDLSLSSRQTRMCIGTVGPDGWTKAPLYEPPAEAEVNTGCRPIDFAAVKTDGAFRLVHPDRGDWELLPLPGSRPFSATIRLSALGRSGQAVRTVEGASSWSCRDGALTLSVDGKAVRYRIRF